ncbi:hypothetical protein [Streptomyces sp. NPDC093984]|uniref:hypothetical protein n=1 Tax=Streptomyces sp. NPDC093984 TaxID=3366052 RepID=UPI0038179421
MNVLVAALVAEQNNLLPERPGVGAAFVPAVVEVGLVLAQVGRADLPLTGEEVFGLGGIGVLLDGAATENFGSG